MKRLIPLAVAVALLASGCTTVLKSKEFGNVKVDGGTTPVAFCRAACASAFAAERR